ncbi:ABC-2 transporter permease [Curtobacterium sp. MCLR17_036]|uniref:ABC-2 transporter permease n=1 Tax=Curtobacterium sp. MCLR17_036 TaxID=2175620 RepID=UPI000DA8C33F|nr:ABC-2 transporter permease [Curtobacterium sp. MCLR17_036]WIE64114.1 ABC-2 transporter permease [Curtobacterium sp. MCLR17_036]
MSTALARFTRFDLTTIALTQPLRVLLPLGFIVVFSVVFPVPGTGIVMGAAIAAVSASVPFQADERGRLDTLYGIAPVGRTAVVLGRYVSMVVYAVVALGVGVAATLAVAAVRQQDVAWPFLATMLLVGAGAVFVAVAVQLPWFFALGYTRGRPMVYIPIAVIAVGAFLVGQTGLVGSSGSPADFAAPSGAVAATVLGIGVVLLAASAALAVRLYRRRQL